MVTKTIARREISSSGALKIEIGELPRGMHIDFKQSNEFAESRGGRLLTKSEIEAAFNENPNQFNSIVGRWFKVGNNEGDALSMMVSPRSALLISDKPDIDVAFVKVVVYTSDNQTKTERIGPIRKLFRGLI